MNQNESTRLPTRLVWGLLALCLLPTLLNALGVDFGVGRKASELITCAVSPDDSRGQLHPYVAGSFLHTILEWTGVSIAIVTAALALVHYAIKGQPAVATIGTALFFSGALDAFHILSADGFIPAAADTLHFIPFSGAVSRLFAVTIKILGASFLLQKSSIEHRKKPSTILRIGILLALIATATMFFCANAPNLPAALFPNAVIRRPWDLGVLILVAFAGAFIYPRLNRTHPSVFAHALWISVIPEALVQLHMSFGTSALYDNHYFVAHFLKILGYLVPFAGLCLAYLRDTSSIENVLAAQEALTQTNHRLQNSMEELDATQSKLIEASRQAGMAEVATGILHNVGNVLNSVNVAADMVESTLIRSEAGDLAKAVHLIRKNADHFPQFMASEKGKKLVDYLIIASDALLAERTTALQETAVLRQNIDHIKRVVAMQQQLARSSASVVEPLLVADVIKNVEDMKKLALTRHEIEVKNEIDDLPPINADKHRLIQILVNLIKNADQALRAGSSPQRILTVKAGRAASGNITIQIIDNGIGIPPEHLTRIFSNGFTTKKDGHGFGLHMSAMAAKEMGGSLTCHSGGIDQGATFTLELPFNPSPAVAHLGLDASWDSLEPRSQS